MIKFGRIGHLLKQKGLYVMKKDQYLCNTENDKTFSL